MRLTLEREHPGPHRAHHPPPPPLRPHCRPPAPPQHRRVCGPHEAAAGRGRGGLRSPAPGAPQPARAPACARVVHRIRAPFTPGPFTDLASLVPRWLRAEQLAFLRASASGAGSAHAPLHAARAPPASLSAWGRPPNAPAGIPIGPPSHGASPCISWPPTDETRARVRRARLGPAPCNCATRQEGMRGSRPAPSGASIGAGPIGRAPAAGRERAGGPGEGPGPASFIKRVGARAPHPARGRPLNARASQHPRGGPQPWGRPCIRRPPTDGTRVPVWGPPTVIAMAPSTTPGARWGSRLLRGGGGCGPRGGGALAAREAHNNQFAARRAGRGAARYRTWRLRERSARAHAPSRTLSTRVWRGHRRPPADARHQRAPRGAAR
jgi:hypothetical protein